MNSKASAYFVAITIMIATFCGCRPHHAIKPPETSSHISHDLEFFSYDEVIAWMKNNPNLIHENVDTSESSLLKSADYYYVDSRSGLLNLIFKDKSVICGGVPIDTWHAFKNADNFDQCYDRNIRNVRFIVWIR